MERETNISKDTINRVDCPLFAVIVLFYNIQLELLDLIEIR